MTKVEFKQHIMQRLGSPVINIEIADEQLDIAIQDTIDKFVEVHYDGLDEGFVFLNLIKDTLEYNLPINIKTVLRVLSITDSLITDEPLLINPYLINNMTPTYSSSVLDLEMYYQNISNTENYLKRQKSFDFNSTTHLIKFFKITSDEKVALQVYSSLVDETLLYENLWVKKYAAALSKIIWAGNIGKYEGATLPGGVSLNYGSILEEGKTEKELLEEELYNRYQEPIDFMWG